MTGMNLNIGSSVFKRETKTITEVADRLRRNGWQQTGSMGEKILYFENSGMSLTLVDAPMATLIFPSGPIRGRIFGDSGLDINQISVIGAGADTGSNGENQNRQARDKVEQLT